MVVEQGLAKLGGLEMSPRELVDVGQVTLLGCGTAYNACSIAAMAIEKLARIPARAEVASEFRHRNPCIDPKGLFFAVSQSGETADTLGAIKEVQIKGGRVMGIVNVVGSSIARQCGNGVYIHSGPEMAVASTKAFSNMVAASYLFTLMLARARTLAPHQAQTFAQGLSEVPDLVAQYLQKPPPLGEVVDWLMDCKMCLFLGRGFSAPVAAEGALKLMEVAYVPCLAYPSGEMKHGPIALLEKGSPVIVIAPEDEVRDKTLSNLQECRARGARIALIHTEGDPIAQEADVSIPIPKTDHWFSPFLSVLPLQMLAYQAGLAMGRDIDRPRNLAKSVTVE
jgi:glucosamine--fructose-6-phosphate aminotransferase (isomerizing)